MVPYKFLKCLFSIYEICHGYFNRDCIESINRFGSMSISIMLILLIHEHGICSHLFVSSLISSVLSSFLSTGLLPPWLGLFQGTLFFLLLYQMGFFFLISVWCSLSGSHAGLRNWFVASGADVVGIS